MINADQNFILSLNEQYSIIFLLLLPPLNIIRFISLTQICMYIYLLNLERKKKK